MQRYGVSVLALGILLTKPADSQERLTFLTAVANKVNNPNSQDAYVYATVAVATVKLELKDLDGARKDLDKSEKILDGFDSVETIVHAAFYRVNAEYYQVCHPAKLARAHLTFTVQTRVRLLLPQCTPLPRMYRPQRLDSL
jgi:hypothetical protein